MTQAEAITAGRHSAEFWCLCWQPQVLHPDPARGYIPFEPYPYQQELMRELAKPQGVVVNKARQIGVSTAAMIEAVRQCVEFGPVQFLDGSKSEDVAKHLLSIAKLAAESHKRPGAPPLTKVATDELRWANGSRIKCLTATEAMGRSYSASVFILDEVAFIENAVGVWASMRPTVSRTARYWLFSTPQGEGDTWHTIWKDESLKAKRMSIPWQMCPEYDDAWFVRERPNYTAQAWASEFECDFLGSGSVPFRPGVIEAAVQLGVEQYAAHGVGLRQRRGRNVITGVDPAGEGEDESVAISVDTAEAPWVVIDGESWGAVPAPILQAGIAQHQQRHGSRLFIENNGVGWAVAQNLDCSYHTITTTSGRQARSEKGHWTVPKTILLNACILAMESGRLAIPMAVLNDEGAPMFAELVRQLRSYRWDDKGLRTDWVMALADAVWPAAQAGQAGPMRVHGLTQFRGDPASEVEEELRRLTAPEFIPPEERENLIEELDDGGYEIIVKQPQAVGGNGGK